MFYLLLGLRITCLTELSIQAGWLQWGTFSSSARVACSVMENFLRSSRKSMTRCKQNLYIACKNLSVRNLFFCLTNEYAFILFQSDIDNFWKDFKLFMMYSMIIQQRAPSVERTIDFIAKFVTMTTSSVPEPEDQNDSTMDDVTNNKLLQKMLDFLLEVSLIFQSEMFSLSSDIVNLLLSSFRDNCHN